MFVDGRLVGTMEHGKSPVLRIPACAPAASAKQSGDPNPRPCRRRGSAELLVLVHAMGRNSAGCDWDFKGLVGSRVLFGGAAERWMLLGPELCVGCTCWPQGIFLSIQQSYANLEMSSAHLSSLQQTPASDM